MSILSEVTQLVDGVDVVLAKDIMDTQETAISAINKADEALNRANSMSGYNANIVSGVWVAGTYTTSGWGSTTINISTSYNSNTDMFSTSSNSITIKKSGYYEVCAITGVRCSLTASLQIYRNSTIITNNWSRVETYGILNSSILTYLEANDVVKFRLYGETGGTGEFVIPDNLGQAGLQGWSIKYLGE